MKQRSTSALVGALVACLIASVAIATRAAGSPPKTHASATAWVSLPPATPTPRRIPTTKPKPRARVSHPSHAAPRAPQVALVRSTGTARRTALLVGVDSTNPSNPLEGGVTDVNYMHSALIQRGFKPADITVLLNGAATRDRVLSELARLVRRTAPGGLAVFSASSHASGTSFRAGDGGRVYATEVAGYLGQIRGRVWTALAMCYAGGFALPGTVGPGRIATFSSDAQHVSYEEGAAGSELFIYMIKRAMIDGAAGGSVEQAFAYARAQLSSDTSSPPPVISDGIPGNVTLRS